MNELDIIANIIKEYELINVCIYIKYKTTLYLKKYNNNFKIYDIIIDDYCKYTMIIYQNIYRLNLSGKFHKIIKLNSINYIYYDDINYYYKYNIIYKNETVFECKTKMKIDKFKNSKNYTNNKLFLIYYKLNDLYYNKIKFNYLNNLIKIIKFANTLKISNYYIKNSKVFICG